MQQVEEELQRFRKRHRVDYHKKRCPASPCDTMCSSTTNFLGNTVNALVARDKQMDAEGQDTVPVPSTALIATSDEGGESRRGEQRVKTAQAD